MNSTAAQRSIDIVIVTYNSAKVIGACLTSLQAAPPQFNHHVIVVDNHSQDDTVTIVKGQFPHVEVIESARNVGFAAGCNRAIRERRSDYVLLLNPDTQVQPGAIDSLVCYLEKTPRAAAVGPQLVGKDGEVQPSCRRFPTLLAVMLRGFKLDRLFPDSRIQRQYLMSDWDHQQARQVDWLLGACILLRREALELIGLLDEGFFLYYEDIDWCYRAWSAGWQVHYLPQARILHHYQRESAQGLNRQLFYHLKSIVRLFAKHRFPLWGYPNGSSGQ